jgi:hypothetical protein
MKIILWATIQIWLPHIGVRVEAAAHDALRNLGKCRPLTA